MTSATRERVLAVAEAAAITGRDIDEAVGEAAVELSELLEVDRNTTALEMVREATDHYTFVRRAMAW